MVAVLAAAAFVLTGCTAGSEAANAAVDHVAQSERCDTCHAKSPTAWQGVYHEKMVRPAAEGLLQEAVDHWVRDSKGNAGPTTGNIDGRSYTLDDVRMVVGSKWKQRYLVRNPATGNHQFLDKQWNSYTRLWEGFAQKDDWETLCTTCHAPGDRADVPRGDGASARAASGGPASPRRSS